MMMKNNIAVASLFYALFFSNTLFAHALLGEHHTDKTAVVKGHLSSETGEITSGDYQYLPDYLVLPESVNLLHGHGLTRDEHDNIFLAYQSKSVAKDSHAIAMFDKQGKFIRFIGDDHLAEGAPHGLDLVKEGDNTVLYLSNNEHTVTKLALDGKVLWQSTDAPDHKHYSEGSYKPTDTTAGPDNQRLFVADGYGNSTVSQRKADDGTFSGLIWNGEEMGGPLNTPHGVTFDPREGRNKLLVSDRGNKRLVYYNLDGSYHSEIKGKGISEACNVDVLGDNLLVPNLDGTVTILGKDNKYIDSINISEVLGEQGHKHPHDAIFLSNGDVVIATWNPGRLSYWKKINNNK